MTVTLIATTTMGLEAMLKRELVALGYSNFRVGDGKVEFDAEISDICKANLWCRTAGRIFLKIGQFEATTFDALFDRTKALNWSDWIGPDDAFPVSKVSSKKSELFSKSDSQAIVKKAVVESLKQSHKQSSLPETGAPFPIRIQIESDVVVLSIDTSGPGLNKRGYRAHMDKAPLRETLAAGLVMLSHYNPERDIVLDPFCGTGTILIEAAMIAKNMAPGLNRTFNAEEWKAIPVLFWEEARQEARDAMNPDAPCQLFGSDSDGRVLDIARENIELAGVSGVHVQTLPMQEVRSRHGRGKIITNPPYGERMYSPEDIQLLYEDMGDVFRKHFPEWKYYILSASENFFSQFGERSTKHRKLFNGGMQCWFYQYF